jgi:hypothetical protein
MKVRAEEVWREAAHLVETVVGCKRIDALSLPLEERMLEQRIVRELLSLARAFRRMAAGDTRDLDVSEEVTPAHGTRIPRAARREDDTDPERG